MTNWESLIAERSRPAERMAESIAKEADLNRRRAYDNTQKRKAQHKAWAQSPAGKKSMRERGKRYQQTEKGREAKRKSSRLYFLRHKDNPEWRAHMRELQRAWREKQKLKTKEKTLCLT